jgi:hypothetical protein
VLCCRQLDAAGAALAAREAAAQQQAAALQQKEEELGSLASRLQEMEAQAEVHASTKYGHHACAFPPLCFRALKCQAHRSHIHTHVWSAESQHTHSPHTCVLFRAHVCLSLLAGLHVT